MDKMILVQKIMERLREPSSWGGVSGILISVGTSHDKATAVCNILAVISGIVAIALKEGRAQR